MSTKTTVAQTTSQLTSNFDLSQLFLGNNKFATATYVNNTGVEVTIEAGTLLGKVTKGTTNADGDLLPHDSSDTEGANVPVGIAAQKVVVANTDSVEITYAIAGDFDVSLLTLGGSDTLDTLVTLSVDDAGAADYVKAVRELILSETGLNPVAVAQLGATDNQ
jgi:hypothetical protein